MKKFRLLVLSAVSIALFALAPVAFAHRPDEGNQIGTTEIPDPNTSFAYYRELDETSAVHFYTFEAQAGQFFHAGINIPKIDSLEDYQVTLALLGPGLPGLAAEHDASQDTVHTSLISPNNSHNSALPVSQLPPGLDLEQVGGLVIEHQLGEDFFEPFTQTNYWGRQELDLDLPETGQYYLVVWNPDEKPGKYVLDTGTREVFEPADLLRFPIWWLNTRLYFEQGPALIAFASFLGLGIVGVILYQRRRN
jgi:hypothetical protein